MKISIKYFAALREAVGTGHEQLTLPLEVTTVGGVRALLRARGGAWAEALAPERAVRMAHQHVMCDGATQVEEGAEVAFFPPVTGG